MCLPSPLRIRGRTPTRGARLRLPPRPKLDDGHFWGDTRVLRHPTGHSPRSRGLDSTSSGDFTEFVAGRSRSHWVGDSSCRIRTGGHLLDVPTDNPKGILEDGFLASDLHLAQLGRMGGRLQPHLRVGTSDSVRACVVRRDHHQRCWGWDEAASSFIKGLPGSRLQGMRQWRAPR